MGQAGRERVCNNFRIEQMGDQMIKAFQQAVHLPPKSLDRYPAFRLARACAAEAVEYMRLFQLAEDLWRKRALGKALKELVQRDGLDFRSRLYLKLYRWHEPYYRWYTSLGWTWLDPIRNGLKRLLLH